MASKHDDACLRRRDAHPMLCTCGVTDDEIARRPPVTTLCGPARNADALEAAGARLRAEGRVVLGLDREREDDPPPLGTTLRGALLFAEHCRKIDRSAAIYVVNPGGYIGTDTIREVAYAIRNGKIVEWLEPWDAETIWGCECGARWPSSGANPPADRMCSPACPKPDLFLVAS